MFKTFLSEFADLLKLVFDGVVMASNQEQGVGQEPGATTPPRAPTEVTLQQDLDMKCLRIWGRQMECPAIRQNAFARKEK